MSWGWNTYGGHVDSGDRGPALTVWNDDTLTGVWINRPNIAAQGLRSFTREGDRSSGINWGQQHDRGPGFPASLSPSVPAWTSWGPGRMDVFARGNNHLFHWWVNDDKWPPNPEQLPGEIDDSDDSSPAAVSIRPGRLDVFAVAKSGDLLHWWNNDDHGGWQGPENLGGNLRRGQQPVAVAKRGLPAGFDVLAVDRNGGLVHWWIDEPGQITTQPPVGAGAVAVAACCTNPGHLEAFTLQDNGSVVHWAWGTQPQTEPIFGSVAANGLGAQGAVSWGPDRIDLFAKGRSGELLHWWRDRPGQFGHETMGANIHNRTVLIDSAPSAVSRRPGQLDVVAWTHTRESFVTLSWGPSFQPPHRCPTRPAHLS